MADEPLERRRHDAPPRPRAAVTGGGDADGTDGGDADGTDGDATATRPTAPTATPATRTAPTATRPTPRDGDAS